MKLLFYLLFLLLACISCRKEEEEKINFINKGSVEGTIVGDKNLLSWDQISTDNNINFSDIVSECDDLIGIKLNAAKHQQSNFSFSIFISKNMLTQKNDSFMSSRIYSVDFFKEDFSKKEFCEKLPRIYGTRREGDAGLSDYILVDTLSNFLKFEKVSRDTIIGSFRGSFISNREDRALEFLKDVDKYLTFHCTKFIAVRDSI
jgi:hypothetical protein